MFVRLIYKNSQRVTLVNLNHVRRIEPSENGGSFVYFDKQDYIHVTQSPAQIATDRDLMNLEG